MLGCTDTTSFRRVRYVLVVIVLCMRITCIRGSVLQFPRIVSFVPSVPRKVCLQFISCRNRELQGGFFFGQALRPVITSGKCWLGAEPPLTVYRLQVQSGM